jgi:hypothetical protein
MTGRASVGVENKRRSACSDGRSRRRGQREIMATEYAAAGDGDLDVRERGRRRET